MQFSKLTFASVLVAALTSTLAAPTGGNNDIISPDVGLDDRAPGADCHWLPTREDEETANAAGNDDHAGGHGHGGKPGYGAKPKPKPGHGAKPKPGHGAKPKPGCPGKPGYPGKPWKRDDEDQKTT